MHLTAAQVQRVLPVPRRPAICECITMRFNAPAEAFIPRNPSQFDQRLPFERRRLSLRAVIIFEFIERSPPGARITVRPEPQVDVKESFCPGFDELDGLPRQ